MNKRQAAIVVLMIFSVLILTACSGSTTLTEDEQIAVGELLGTTDNLTDVTSQVMTAERQEKFPAVVKVAQVNDGDYAFVCEPVGYYGPMRMVVAIDTEQVVGIRILEHMESPEYVRDMESAWFVDRFRGKALDQYLESTPLEAQYENQIVAITGSTVTTIGVVNGVNAAIGVYNEEVLGQSMPAVDLMVEGFVGPVSE